MHTLLIKNSLKSVENKLLFEDNCKAANSPNYRYRFTEEALKLIQSFGTVEWETNLEKLKRKQK